MDRVLVIVAALGVVLLWHRAKPLVGLREWVVIRANRIWQRLITSRVPGLALPFWWLKGMLGCGECLSPYAGFFLALCWRNDLRSALVDGLATYALYVALFARNEGKDT